MGLKDFYYSLEDKWYSLMDSLNDKGIPVYSIIDPIDKIVPSLIVFIIASLLLISGVVLVLTPHNDNNSVVEEPGFVSLTVKVKNLDNDFLNNARVKIELIDSERVLSERTDSSGVVEVSVPVGEKVLVSVSKNGFIDSEKEFRVLEDVVKTIVLSAEDNSFEQSFIFLAPNGSQLSGENITARFSCSNETISFEEPIQETMSGEVSLIVPEGCGIVLVDVTANGYENKKYSSEGGIIRLSKPEPLKGIVNVSVYSENNVPLKDIEVSVLTGEREVGVKYSNELGQVSFELTYGFYKIQLIDPKNKFTGLIESIELNTDYESLSYNLSEDPFGKIILTARNANSKEFIPSSFRIRVGEKNYTLSSSDENLSVVFLAKEPGKYFVKAVKEGFVSSQELEVDLTEKGSVVEKIIDLNPCTPLTCSPLKVKVIDEDGLPVENALVNLNDANTGFLKTSISERTTDVNGYAKPDYTLIENGVYYATAIKYPASGESEEFEVKNGEKVEVTIPITIGSTSVSVQVSDEYGENIPFANVELIDARGEELGVIKTDKVGFASYELKADKEIYLRVTKKNYAPWVSQLIQLFPETPVSLNSVLVKDVLSDTPLIEFKGLFEKNTLNLIDSPEPARTYDALFEVTIPTNQVFDSVGLHLRTGASEMIEKDWLFISRVNAPNTSIIKGTSFNPENNGVEKITNGASKWVNVVWSNPEPGKYLVKAEVKVKPSTPPLTPLPIYYRVWGEKENKFFKNPRDKSLSNGENSNNSLYSNCYSKIYFEEEMKQACENDYCFFNDVLDLKQDYYLNEPFKFSINNDYNLSFNIINNTEELLNNAELRIKIVEESSKTSELIRINSYEIHSSDNKVYSSDSPLFELPRLKTGNWKPGKSVNGVLLLESMDEGNAFISFEIVSDKRIVFSKLLPVENFFEFNQDLNINPEFIPAFSETLLTVTSKYKNGKDKGKPIVNALITLERETSTYDKSFSKKKTDKTGSASFVVPASSPETIIKITSRKPSVLPESREIKISGQVLEINPESISSDLDTTVKTEEKFDLVLKNLIGKNQVIKSIKVSGKTKGLLDALQMENYFHQFVGEIINAGGEKEISLILALSPDASDLFYNTSISGEVLIETTSTNGFTTWFSKLPFTINIDVGRTASEEGCLTITPKEWKTAIYEDSSVLEFEVFNNCLDKAGNPLDLENLEAKISWNSNSIGLVELSLIDSTEGMNANEVLSNGRWTPLFNDVPSETVYEGYLKFTALKGHVGETAKFTIDFQASTPSGEGGYNYLKSDGAINAVIDLVDLKECIKFTPNPEAGVIIKGEEDSSEFSVDTSACHGIPIDFRFCDRGKNKCRGEAKEGGIFLTPWELKNVNTSNDDNSSKGKKVIVQRETIPGTYGIKIEARPKGGSYREITEMLVTVKPKPSKFLDLERTNFMIIGEGTKDETAVFNRMFLEDVQVKANLCNWKKAEDNGNMKKSDIIVTSVGAGAATAYTIVQISASAGPWGAAVGVIVAIAVYLVLSHENKWSNYCKKHYYVGVLQDFVVNLVGGDNDSGSRHLPPDLISLKLDTENVLSEMNSEVVDEYSEPETNKSIQQVGFVFTNAGLNSPKPVYGLLEVTMKEHVHGDETHSNSDKDEFDVFCKNEYFGSRWIGKMFNQGLCEGANDKVKTEKFHVRFVSDVEKNELPEVSFDEFDCTSSIRTGKTGEEYLPRVRFNWDWAPAVNGIGKNSCDASNPNFIYCDATQFTIELSQKINALYEFLKVNNFDLGCPPQIDSEATAINNYNEEFSNHEVEANKAGLTSVKSELVNDTAIVKINVQNNSSASRVIPVKATMALTYSNEKTIENLETQDCEQTISVSSGGIEEVTCEFTVEEDGIYSITVTPTINEDWVDTYILMHNLRKGEQTFTYPDNGTGCWLTRTTESYFGRPIILDFVEAKEPIWTSEIPNVTALRNLLKFNAYLIQDGYSKDFRKDFVEFYSNQGFVTAPTWFNSLEQKQGKTLGVKDLLKDEENFYFTKKYSTGEETLSSPGLYSIELAVYFNGKDWSFFDEEGKPLTKIAIIFYKTLDPIPNSPFYYLPIDGFVGVEGDSVSRQGYGVSFINENAEEQINFTNDTNPVKTFSDYGSNPIKMVTSKKTESIKKLNTILGTRGNVLRVTNKRNEGIIDFSPSNATPVLMTITENNEKQEETSAYYTLNTSGLNEETGSVLTYWSGAGRCLDFTGVPVTETFNYSADRKATSEDKVKTSNWINSYAIDFPSIEYPGKTFLRTIFYTPQKKESTLVGQSSNIEFSSISGTGKNISLTGLGKKINSIQEVFELVKTRDLCITSNGSTANFWWNPKKIYNDSGMTQAMQTLNAVENPGSCIGYSNPSENETIPVDTSIETSNNYKSEFE